MATIRPRGKSWEVQVCVNRIRRTATFPTKTQCRAWAAAQEVELRAAKSGAIPNKPFSDLLEKYRDEISVTKRGDQWEQKRISSILRDEIAKVRLPLLDATHFALWRDRRLAEVSPATVLRDWTLINHAINIAVREWKWLPANPLKDVRRPPPPPSRDRRISDDEITRLMYAFGWDRQSKPTNITQRCAIAFMFAIETAMRAGEIVGLTTDRIRDKSVRLPLTKNGTATRTQSGVIHPLGSDGHHEPARTKPLPSKDGAAPIDGKSRRTS